jgi:hypothetical protein
MESHGHRCAVPHADPICVVAGAFIYQIVTTPLAAVDAPTLVRSAAAQSAAVAALPVRAPHAHAASGTRPVEALRGPRSWVTAVLAIAGLVAVIFGGLLFLHIAHGAAVCSQQAFEVCSQGFVLLTGTQLAGGAIAIAGIGSLVVAIILALR